MSFKNFFSSILTPPHYLKMSVAGLDISDQAVRFIEFSRNKYGLEIKSFGEKKLPVGLIVSGKIIKRDELISILSELRKKYSLKFVKVSLPEEKAYFFKTEVPKIAGSEIRQNIEFKLEENVPLRANEALFSYSVIENHHINTNHFDVSVSVVPKLVAETYADVLEKSGLTPLSFEVESKAVTRSVVTASSKGSIMVVNIRDRVTVITLVRNGAVWFTSAFAIGGNSINEVLRKNFSVSFDGAEKIKEEKMYFETKESLAIFFSLVNVASSIRDEVSKIYTYWLAKNDQDGKAGGKIEKIILCGKDSAIVGLREYLEESIRVDVEIANVWTNLFSLNEKIPEIDFLKSLDFSVAIGLASSNINN